MSKLLSFLKKKDHPHEESSPPPSPKPKIDSVVESSNKTVKQTKRRKRDILKKRVSDLIMNTDDDSSRRHSIGTNEDDIDSNGNSMAPKTESPSSTGSADADSLRDVESICEEETQSKNNKPGLSNAVDEAFEDLVDDASSRTTSPDDVKASAKLVSSDTVYSSCGPDQKSDCSGDEEFHTAKSGLESAKSNGHHSPKNFIYDAVNSAMLENLETNIPSIEINSCHGSDRVELDCNGETDDKDISISLTDSRNARENISKVIGRDIPIDDLETKDITSESLDTSAVITSELEDSLSELDLSQSPSKSSFSSNSSRSVRRKISIEKDLSKLEDSEERSQAEARLAQRRAARAEARELRLKELERQQLENPDQGEDASDMSATGDDIAAENINRIVKRFNLKRRSLSRVEDCEAYGPSVSRRRSHSGSQNGSNSSAKAPLRTTPTRAPPVSSPSPNYRRTSTDSTHEDTTREISDLEEKFRGAMISNASLDNEKSQLTYQVEVLKDVKTDLSEQLTQLKKEHKKKCSEHEQLRKVYGKLQEESRMVRRVLEERDLLIQEFGLVVVGNNTEEDDEEESDEGEDPLMDREETNDGLVLPRPVPMKRVLLSTEAAEILEKGAAKGSLEWRLRRVVEHKRELEDELRRVNLELEDQLNNQRQNNSVDYSVQKEATKTVNEYKFRVQKAEAEVSSLQANVNRLEALVTRYKVQSEELEKSEEELKTEKRRLQREFREAQSSLEELQTTNTHLMRRFDKLKNARSNLLKDLSQDPVT